MKRQNHTHSSPYLNNITSSLRQSPLLFVPTEVLLGVLKGYFLYTHKKVYLDFVQMDTGSPGIYHLILASHFYHVLLSPP